MKGSAQEVTHQTGVALEAASRDDHPAPGTYLGASLEPDADHATMHDQSTGWSVDARHPSAAAPALTASVSHDGESLELDTCSGMGQPIHADRRPRRRRLGVEGLTPAVREQAHFGQVGVIRDDLHHVP